MGKIKKSKLLTFSRNTSKVTSLHLLLSLFMFYSVSYLFCVFNNAAVLAAAAGDKDAYAIADTLFASAAVAFSITQLFLPPCPPLPPTSLPLPCSPSRPFPRNAKLRVKK